MPFRSRQTLCASRHFGGWEVGLVMGIGVICGAVSNSYDGTFRVGQGALSKGVVHNVEPTKNLNKMIKISTILLLTLIFGLGIYSCDNKSSSKVEMIEKKTAVFDINTAKLEIQGKTNQFTEAHITKDTTYLNNSFTDDARVFPPNSEIVTGKNAISPLNTDWVNYGISEFKEVSTSFYGNEEYLIDEGNYHLRYGDDNEIDNGKYVTIWKNVKGEWKIYSNIWNTNLPLE